MYGCVQNNTPHIYRTIHHKIYIIGHVLYGSLCYWSSSYMGSPASGSGLPYSSSPGFPQFPPPLPPFFGMDLMWSERWSKPPWDFSESCSLPFEPRRGRLLFGERFSFSIVPVSLSILPASRTFKCASYVTGVTIHKESPILMLMWVWKTMLGESRSCREKTQIKEIRKLKFSLRSAL